MCKFESTNSPELNVKAVAVPVEGTDADGVVGQRKHLGLDALVAVPHDDVRHLQLLRGCSHRLRPAEATEYDVPPCPVAAAAHACAVRCGDDDAAPWALSANRDSASGIVLAGSRSVARVCTALPGQRRAVYAWPSAWAQHGPLSPAALPASDAQRLALGEGAYVHDEQTYVAHKLRSLSPEGRGAHLCGTTCTLLHAAELHDATLDARGMRNTF